MIVKVNAPSPGVAEFGLSETMEGVGFGGGGGGPPPEFPEPPPPHADKNCSEKRHAIERMQERAFTVAQYVLSRLGLRRTVCNVALTISLLFYSSWLSARPKRNSVPKRTIAFAWGDIIGTFWGVTKQIPIREIDVLNDQNAKCGGCTPPIPSLPVLTHSTV